MDILTFVLIGVLVLLSLSCFMGMGNKKGGLCCDSRKESKKQQRFEESSQSNELQKIYTQMDQVEKVNQNLLKEIEKLNKEKESTT